MNLKGQHILSAKQFDKELLLEIFQQAKKFEENGGDGCLKGKIMATLFCEPSTRTRFSFETAMLRLGGDVVSNFDMMNNSSFTKRETLFDTGKVVSQMVDVIVMRHPVPVALHELAKGSEVPVINAGNGPQDHPTQAMLDAYTIWKEFGKLDGLTVGVIGDLKYSRVLHSQVMALKNFGVKFVLVSPKELQLPVDLKERIDFVESENLSEVISEMDVISVNRIQEERFASKEEAEKFRGKFVVNNQILARAKEKAIVLCPLPRVEELPTEIDGDGRIRFFTQVKNGVFVRMALLKMVLG
ncbi:aspartate carbamoyltransferase [Candidatus Peregrinibacteria bacterium]|nr:aspartate carbamoyltransferase [Candidatus Peregrinibacteria bacterium]